MVPKKILVVVILILILGLIVGGGVLVYKSIGKKPAVSVPSVKLSPTPTKTSNPTPTPTPAKISLSNFKIQVLNGSGVAGVAGEVKDLLEKEGAKDVTTDNADAYDYQDTQIQLKKEVGEKVFAKLKEILADYNVVESKTLQKSSDYDIIIIVGTKE